MKKILASLLAPAGGARAQQPSPEVQYVDPSTIRASIPTMSEDAAPVVPLDAPPGDDDLLFHEDDWRQVEFFPAARLPEVQRLLTEYAPFEAANRTPYGWTRLYLRSIPPAAVLPAPDALHRLEWALNVTAGPAPVLHTSSALVGRVRDGFTLPLGGNVTLYGYTETSGIPVLGAGVGPDPDDIRLAEAFMTLHAAAGLILVDWRAQLVLLGVSEEGQIEVWQP